MLIEKGDLNENKKRIKKRIKRTSQGSLGKSNLAQYHSYCRINHQHVADRIMQGMLLKQSVQQTAMYLQEVPERTSEAPLLRLSERC